MRVSRFTKIVLCCTLLVSACTLQGCSNETTVSPDILTQKKTEEGRTQITVLVKYAFTINQFEKIVEEKFPDIDIVQVGNYTSNTTLAKEFEARLAHDDLTDIVMTWPLDVGKEYWDDRLIDLSGMTFTSKYNNSMLDTIANDGKLYFLPGPAEIRGIVYNKTLFEERGWKVPSSYEEFLKLCGQIQDTGMRSLLLSVGNAEVLDAAFVGYNYASSFSKPADTNWLYQYNEKGEGSFKDHFAVALGVFQELIDAGILRKEDLNLHYQDTQLALFTRQTAMVEDSVLLTHQGERIANSTDEFALMPFFNKNPESDWARLYMTCFIGLNKHLQDHDQKAKYDKVMKLMEFISTPEGQQALSADTGAMFSSLKEVAPPNVKEIEALIPALSQGRYAQFPVLKHAQDALRTALAGMVQGTMSANDVSAAVDRANADFDKNEELQVLGQAKEDFSLIETGNFVTDVMREYCESDVALFLDNGKDGLYNGKGISARLYKGDITETDLLRVFPDLKHGETGELWKVEMTGKDLLETLEYALEVDSTTGWFYYFSGLKMTYDPTAEPGSRVSDLTMADGSKLAMDKVYSIAVMEDSVPEDFLISKQNTEILIQDLLKESIQSKKDIQPSNDQRFKLPQ